MNKMNKMLKDSVKTAMLITSALKPKVKPKKYIRKVRLQGSMRTYFIGETMQQRLNRIESETQQRLNADQKKRKHPRCMTCNRKVQSKAHRCKNDFARSW